MSRRSSNPFLSAPALLAAFRGSMRLLVWGVVAAVLLYLCSGITVVGPNEVGTVLRCGKIAGFVHPPGLLLALAAGNLSIAMGALGSDVAIHTSDVALMSNDLRRVADFLRLADRTLAVVNQNFLGGLGFIVLAVGLSGAGYISPVVAAFLHEAGAFFVIFNSARLLKFEGR